jgi:hypothetical protein
MRIEYPSHAGSEVLEAEKFPSLSLQAWKESTKPEAIAKELASLSMIAETLRHG